MRIRQNRVVRMGVCMALMFFACDHRVLLEPTNASRAFSGLVLFGVIAASWLLYRVSNSRLLIRAFWGFALEILQKANMPNMREDMSNMCGNVTTLYDENVIKYQQHSITVRSI